METPDLLGTSINPSNAAEFLSSHQELETGTLYYWILMWVPLDNTLIFSAWSLADSVEASYLFLSKAAKSRLMLIFKHSMREDAWNFSGC